MLVGMGVGGQQSSLAGRARCLGPLPSFPPLSPILVQPPTPPLQRPPLSLRPVNACRCEQSDTKRDGFRIINQSHYHSAIGVTLPPYELTTSWTRDLRRFDNVITALWVLYQVRSRVWV